MTDQSLLESLRAINFLHDIGDEHLQKLSEISRFVDFPAQSTIFQEHQAASDVYVIVSGEVALIICTPTAGCRTLTEVGPGDLIGWSPLVGRSRLSDTARTITATKAIAIKGDQLLAMCGENPRFGFEFMHRVAQVLAQRLSSTRMKLLEMTGHRLPQIALESD